MKFLHPLSDQPCDDSGLIDERIVAGFVQFDVLHLGDLFPDSHHISAQGDVLECLGFELRNILEVQTLQPGSAGLVVTDVIQIAGYEQVPDGEVVSHEVGDVHGVGLGLLSVHVALEEVGLRLEERRGGCQQRCSHGGLREVVLHLGEHIDQCRVKVDVEEVPVLALGLYKVQGLVVAFVRLIVLSVLDVKIAGSEGGLHGVLLAVAQQSHLDSSHSRVFAVVVKITPRR